jgi:hypothetical protein
MSNGTNDLLVKVEMLRNLLVSRATTQGPWNARQYTLLRQELLAIPGLKEKLPTFVQTTFTLEDFWGLIKLKFDKYQQRRDYLRDEFTPVLQYLETQQVAPADAPITTSLKTWGAADIHSAWQKALDRRERDPEGAITAARTLLETTCKAILEQQAVPYEDAADLPALYHAAAATLNLAPEQHHEKVFKSILGGWSSPYLCVIGTPSEAPRLLHAALATTTSFGSSKDMSR